MSPRSRKTQTSAGKLALCACGEHTGPGGKAVGVDAEIKASAQRRLNRIEGQVRGLKKMVDEERYCADILSQISSVEQALRGLGRELMHNHLRHCATEAIRKDEASAEKMYDELLDLVYRHVR
ncbi:MAG: metal-sensitive transcriptional regulator [Acidobacteriaceae bacterium]